MSNPQIHIIVQAGGRGSRLRHHTWNKPKCLVSVHGKPLLYHLFDRFPDANFSIIGDYAFEQLEKYLQVNKPSVTHSLIKASGSGTASGIAQALTDIHEDTPVILLWSDLIVGDLPAWPQTSKPVVCISSAFTCRWSLSSEGKLHESTSATDGIPGLFYFPKRKLLTAPPISGEFVKWLAANLTEFDVLDCPNLQELGDFATIEKENDAAGFSRFFNQVTINEQTVEKRAIDPNYQSLIEKELTWYEQSSQLGFRRIPRIISSSPFVMERVKGEHLYRIKDLSPREQRAVFADYLDSLISLHDKKHVSTQSEDIFDVYVKKTIDRVSSVSSIIPGFERESMTVNGKKCRNVFSEKYQGTIESLLPHLQPDFFCPIHGDATFSNTLVDDKLRSWFIDPRGYFSKSGIMGDPWYDFAKVYYSAIGGYDAFNRRKFKLHIDHETIEVLYEEPLYSGTALDIFSDYFGKDLARIEVLHGLIWLALSGYAKDDVDSVIASFYLGLYWLESGRSKL
jgi:GTP:adenosylcobinamide-phosphate guanylyltransferase